MPEEKNVGIGSGIFDNTNVSGLSVAPQTQNTTLVVIWVFPNLLESYTPSKPKLLLKTKSSNYLKLLLFNNNFSSY